MSVFTHNQNDLKSKIDSVILFLNGLNKDVYGIYTVTGVNSQSYAANNFVKLVSSFDNLFTYIQRDLDTINYKITVCSIDENIIVDLIKSLSEISDILDDIVKSLVRFYNRLNEKLNAFNLYKTDRLVSRMYITIQTKSYILGSRVRLCNKLLNITL